MAEGVSEEGNGREILILNLKFGDMMDWQDGKKTSLAVLGFFFAGLFILALGLGLFFFKNKTSGDDIQIISSADSGSAQSGEIVVHVDGEVARPGIYKLGTGSRVNDAISAAGGLTQEADRSKVNLAAKVADGQKIFVFARSEQGLSNKDEGLSSQSDLISINDASEAELDKLPGVGPATAQKIISSRPYSAPDDLLSKKAVSKSVYEKIKDLISI